MLVAVALWGAAITGFGFAHALWLALLVGGRGRGKAVGRSHVSG